MDRNDFPKDEMDALQRAADGSEKGIRDSTIFLSLFTESAKKDPVCLMQLALAILHNKPLVFIVIEPVVVPEALVKIAVYVERIKDSSEMEAATRRALDAATEYLAKKEVKQ